jgi:hypothetical protein
MKLKKLRNRGMVQDFGALLVMFVLIVGAGVSILMVANYMGLLSTPSGGSTGGGTIGVPPVVTSACGDDGLGTIKVRAKNSGNETAAEWYAATVYLYKKVNGGIQYVTSTTTATDGTYATFNNTPCNAEYVMYILSADGAAGDNNNIDAIDASSENIKLVGGAVEIDMADEDVYATVHSTQHATLEFRAYDNNENGYMYDTGDSAATDWETTGVVFTSTTNNDTNMTVAAGGDFNVELQIRAAQTDTQFQADGANSIIIAVNGDIGTWDELDVDCGGKSTEVSPSELTEFERNLWSGYEKFFKLDKILENNPRTSCTLTGIAKPSVSSWKCPSYTFAARGNYVGTTSGVIELHSAAKDDSSYTNVYTVQTMSLQLGPAAGTTCSASS